MTVEKIKVISMMILVSPNCSGVKNFGKRYSTLNAPMANPMYMIMEE
jgi:hypothetical protein